MVPVVLVLLANDKQSPLDLGAEKETLRKVFNDKTKVELKILENETFDYVSDSVLDPELRKRIVVFHYAGHADKRNIRLIDGNSKAEGLAAMLKTFPNLQLIFLNGCDTYDQTFELQKAGITTAIITTLVPVNDELAILFAFKFYYAFYTLNPIDDSFESAKTRFIAKESLQKNHFACFDRGLAQSNDEIDTHQKEGKSVYILSATDSQQLKRTFLFELEYQEQPVLEANYRPNRVLITSLANSIVNNPRNNAAFKESEGFKALNKSYINFTGNPNNRNFSLMVDEVLRMLPHPLAFQVNLLSTNGNDWDNKNAEKKVELLKRQIITYDYLVQLLAFTMLSCFWNEFKENNKLIISDEQWQIIRSFLLSNDIRNQDINYPALLVAIREIFEKNFLTPFISEYQELRNIFETEDTFYETHIYMQGMKTAIKNGEIKKLQIDWLCSNTEKKLTPIFSKSGFVTQYKLTTVKNIEFIKSRLKGPSYYITRNILDRTKVIDDDVEEFPSYTDSRSVILATGTDPLTFCKFLTLSPFIIDENALCGKNMARLFFYSHRVEDGYVYRWTEDPDVKLKITEYTYEYHDNKGDIDPEKVLINNRMKNIIEELESFEKLVTS